MGENETEIARQSLLPTFKDPKLWIVKCRRGAERKIAASILLKYYTLQSREPLSIYSVVTLDYLKGSIYIEADRESSVTQALEGIDGIFAKEPQLVPLPEMPDVLKTNTQPLALKKGDWVRVKRGLYKGDLAKVYYHEQITDMVTIQIIPRIDLQAWSKRLMKQDEDEDLESKKRKRKPRPPAKLFNPEEVRALPGGENAVHEGRMARTGEEYYMFENNRFRDGFVYKTVNVKSLQIDGIQPSLDELEKFSLSSKSSSDDTVEQDFLPKNTIPSNVKKYSFKKGDSIEVIKGELISVVGFVHSVEGSKVVFRPANEKIHGKELLTLPIDQVRKYFKIGDHIMVLPGRNHEGETGFITALNDTVATVFSDNGEKTFKVFTSDIYVTSEIAKAPSTASPESQQPLRRGHDNRGNIGRPNFPAPQTSERRFGNRRLLDKTVTITRGQWKGHIGTVKSVNDRFVKVILSSQTKTVTVDEEHIRVDDDSFQRPKTDSRDPFSIAPPTPRRMATPRRPSTPSHDTPWNPISAPSTPAPDSSWRDDEESNVFSRYSSNSWSDVQTPGVVQTPFTPNPVTPHNPMTPHTPNTPAPQTPHVPTTPITPHPQTPHHPITPHPLTPVSQGTYDYPETPAITTETATVEETTSLFTLLIEVEITFGQHSGKKGVIKTIEDDSCGVELLDSKEIVSIPKDSLSLVVPEKRDKVIILKGEYKDETGYVLGIDNTDGIVKLSHLDIRVLDMSNLAKYHGEV